MSSHKKNELYALQIKLSLQSPSSPLQCRYLNCNISKFWLHLINCWGNQSSLTPKIIASEMNDNLLPYAKSCALHVT